MGRFDWPDRATRRLDDLSLWDVISIQPTLLYDGSWLARMWWDVRHPPKWVSWTPPWRRHKRRCNKRFEQAAREALAGKPDELKRLTAPMMYCSTCDYWELTPRNPVFWLVLVFGEH